MTEPFKIDPELLENDDVRITTVDGQLAIEHRPTGHVLTVDGDLTLSDIKDVATSGSHDDLSDVASDDHHAKTTSAEIDHQQTTNRTHDGDDIEPASVTTEVARTKNQHISGHTVDDYAAGRVSGGRWSSWPATMGNITRFPWGRERPVVVISSEGSDEVEYDEAYPRYRDRGIPWQMGATPARIGGTTNVSQSELSEMRGHGVEVALYTGGEEQPFDGNLHDADLDGLVELITDQKRELEQMGFPITCLMPRGQNGIDFGWIDSAVSHMIRSQFAITGHSSIPSLGGARSTLSHGFPRATTSSQEGEFTPAGMSDRLDDLEKTQRGVFWIHWHHVGIDDNNEWDELEQVLDDIQQRRDNGDIDVMTPTGSGTIPWGVRDHGDIVEEPSPTSGDFDDSLWGGFATDPDVSGDEEFWIMGGGDNHQGLSTRRIPLVPYFQSMMVQFDAKGVESDNIVRIQWSAPDTIPSTSIEKSVGDTWETVFHPLGIPRTLDGSESGGTRLGIWARSNDNEVHVKNVKIYPI